VQVSVQLSPEHGTYADLRAAAIEADRLGADAIYNWDHFWPLRRPVDGDHYEAWTTMGSWAETTSRSRIGTLVSCAGYRNPDLLADMARTIDHISGGRLILGLGAGFREKEYVEYGYEFPGPGGRVDALQDTLERVTARLPLLHPAPTGHIPILVAGGGHRVLRLVARYADIWNTFAEGEELAAKIKVLEKHCLEVGRDMSSIECEVLIGGDPVEAAAPYRALGVNRFVVTAHGPDWDLTELHTWLDWRDRQDR
jgi:probable F420-dependent oxidoreductase